MPPLAALLGVGLFLVGCTFERRPTAGQSTDGPSSSPPTTVEDSVLTVVNSLQHARDRGDLAAALALFDGEARVSGLVLRSDGDAAPSWRSPREALEEEGSRSLVQPGLELLESSVAWPGGGTALVLRRYVDVERAPVEPSALESLLLVRGTGGWRILHLHRSFSSSGPGGP
jgi:hypothetical protein